VAGKLRYEDGGWSGDLHLADAVIPFEAFSDPLHLTAADVTIDGSGLTVKRMELSPAALRRRASIATILRRRGRTSSG